MSSTHENKPATARERIISNPLSAIKAVRITCGKCEVMMEWPLAPQGKPAQILQSLQRCPFCGCVETQSDYAIGIRTLLTLMESLNELSNKEKAIKLEFVLPIPAHTEEHES